MEKNKALFSIQNAYMALRASNRTEARNWAIKAIEISPDLTDGWILLAKLGSPRASIYYLKRALQIDPSNIYAKKALQKAIRQISGPTESKSLNIREDLSTDKKPLPKEIYKTQKSKNRTLGQAVVSIILVMMVLVVSLILWITFSNNRTVLAKAPAISRPTGVILKPTLTSTPTLTPTMTLTPTPTSTPTITPTYTPTYTPTQTYTPTFTPTNTLIPSNTPNVVPRSQQMVDRPQNIGSKENWIDVDLSQQRLYAYTGDELIRSFLISSGTWRTPTITGTFRIYIKFLSTKMEGPGYYLPNVPYVMYFYKGYGIHGTYWHNNFGTPMSHGCINMATDDAEWVYYWSNVGTIVIVHE